VFYFFAAITDDPAIHYPEADVEDQSHPEEARSVYFSNEESSCSFTEDGIE